MWWASLADARPEHVRLLDTDERGRRDRYLRDEDRDRFTIGVALTRLILSAALGLAPERVLLDRTCRDCGGPHGAPRLGTGTGPYVSVSHSGDRIAVAVSPDGPLGVDVEATGKPLTEDLGRHVLTAAEQAELVRLPEPDRTGGLLAYWTRKEAVLKATGDGLRVPMTELTVSGPTAEPRLLAWPARPGLPERITLRLLEPGPGHIACLALVDQSHATLRQERAAALLGSTG